MFNEIVGIDVSTASLENAKRRLRLESMLEQQKERIKLRHGALTYRDQRIEGYDAAALLEVIEDLDADRLEALEWAVFEFAQSDHVIITPPNREYNVKIDGMQSGQLRHADHRFVRTREEFKRWALPVADRFGYGIGITGIGEVDSLCGAPTQMPVFSRV